MILILVISLVLITAGIYFFFTEITFDDKAYKQFHFQQTRPSVNQLYTLIESAFHDQHIAGLKVTRYIRREGGIFSPQREYLRIQFKTIYVEVSAFHFGNGLSVTFRRGIKMYVQKIFDSTSFFTIVIRDIFFAQTAYRLDSEQAYKNNVDATVTDAINRLTSSHGVRQ